MSSSISEAKELKESVVSLKSGTGGVPSDMADSMLEDGGAYKPSNEACPFRRLASGALEVLPSSRNREMANS